MDRSEGALLVAEAALSEVRKLAAELRELRAVQESSMSFVIDETGCLMMTAFGGQLKNLGKVRGADGKDAPFIQHARIEDGDLAIQMSNGETFNAGRVVGDRGEPGRDGLSLKGFSVELLPDGKTLALQLRDEEVTFKEEIQFPVTIHRGVWREGNKYAKGDSVTWAGSCWISQRETVDKPESSDAWLLSVKRGRDGRDGRNGIDGKNGSPGAPGKDGKSWV